MFKVGDKARLNEGGRVMTVSRVMTDCCECRYERGSLTVVAVYRNAELTLARE